MRAAQQVGMRTLVASMLVSFLSACGGATVDQLDQAKLTVMATREAGGCRVVASIPPLDDQFATSGIQATLNGPVEPRQAEAGHDVFNVLAGRYHVPARPLVASRQFALDAPQPEVLEVSFFDASGSINARVANPCFLDQLGFDAPGDTARAFRPGELIVLSSDPRGSWGTDRVTFTLRVGKDERTVAALANHTRLVLVVPDLGLTQPTQATLITTQRAAVPAFEKCEGVSSCELVEGESSVSVNVMLEP